MVIFGVPTRTLDSPKRVENKFSGVSGDYSRVRNEKIYRAIVSKLKSQEGIPSCARKRMSNRTSVSNVVLGVKCLWRKENYSSRYLLYESLRVRGKPSTMVSAGRTRREACSLSAGVACSLILRKQSDFAILIIVQCQDFDFRNMKREQISEK